MLVLKFVGGFRGVWRQNYRFILNRVWFFFDSFFKKYTLFGKQGFFELPFKLSVKVSGYIYPGYVLVAFCQKMYSLFEMAGSFLMKFKTRRTNFGKGELIFRVCCLSKSAAK